MENICLFKRPRCSSLTCMHASTSNISSSATWSPSLCADRRLRTLDVAEPGVHSPRSLVQPFRGADRPRRLDEGRAHVAGLLPRVLRPRNVSFALSHQLSCFTLRFDWRGFDVWRLRDVLFFYSKKTNVQRFQLSHLDGVEMPLKRQSTIKCDDVFFFEVCSSLKQFKVTILQILVPVDLGSLLVPASAFWFEHRSHCFVQNSKWFICH